MSPRPAIFISAASSELRSARQLVANTLTFLGYDPEWQDVFGTEEGDLRAMLRRRIDSCKAVLQLVGQCYGTEPPSIDERFGRVSYTQYEALYAASTKKKVRKNKVSRTEYTLGRLKTVFNTERSYGSDDS